MLKPLALGVLTYVNAWPVYHDFLFGQLPPWLTLVEGIPSELNRLLGSGRISASCISSIEYVRLQDRVRLLPGICLASSGRVGSVLLFSPTALENLGGRKIFVTEASATSGALLRVLLDRWGIRAEISGSPWPEREAVKEQGAFLLIGDQALMASRSPGRYRIYDLGLLWKEATGLPFVWALWAVHQDAFPHAERLLDALYRSREKGLIRLPFLVRAASQKLGLDSPILERYFHGLRYFLGEQEMEALHIFFRMASETPKETPCPTV